MGTVGMVSIPIWWVGAGVSGYAVCGYGGYAVSGYGGYAGMCASRALAVPPSHPLIPTALHFDPLYFTSRQFFTKAL